MTVGSTPPQIVAAVADAISAFGVTASPRFAPGIAGESEDKIRGPIETLLSSVGEALGLTVTPGGEARVSAIGIRSDFAVHVDNLLAGHLEVKAPGKGADPTRYTGHDRKQWERSKSLPNLLYTDGNQWALFRYGERVGEIVVLAGDVKWSGASLRPLDGSLARMLASYLSWKPQAPTSASELAHTIAGLCRLLRDEVEGVLEAEAAAAHEEQVFTRLAADWRELLFPGASDSRFADSYAQTVTFAMLLARADGIPIDQLDTASQRLGSHYRVLGRALQMLVDSDARARVATSLEVLQRVIGVVDWNVLSSGQLRLPGVEPASGHIDSPWLYFYEDFLSAYDAELRKQAGAYYTPPEVVGAQVRLTSDLLRTRLGKGLGFAADGVVTLDPAMGTGGYLLGVIHEASNVVTKREGKGAVEGRLSSLADHLIGFEIMTGPYSVAELQVTEALRRHGLANPAQELRLHLADTLSDPYADETHLGALYEPIASSRRAADRVKTDEHVLVCIGNPPYDRHSPGSGLGGWVRFGGANSDQTPIFDDFLASDIKPGHIASIYNLYAYFWRWALWKVFECHQDAPSGVVAFITSSSFVAGPGFAAMREHMRRTADEVWVLDLGGEGHGTRQDDNVFPTIQTPVAITLCMRKGKPRLDRAASVHYARVNGTRAEKLAYLRTVSRLGQVDWTSALNGWRDSFAPPDEDAWAALPALFDLFPWRQPGLKAKRTWPIAPTKEALRQRWAKLGAAGLDERKVLFKEDVHRKLKTKAAPLPGFDAPEPETLNGTSIGPCPPIERYGYRSLDREYIIADSRLMGQPSTALWQARSDRQVHLVTLHAVPLDGGPGVVATAEIPDLNSFRGNSTGAVLPLWRDSAATESNTAPGLLAYLAEKFGEDITPEAFAAYVAAVLGHGGYTSRFEAELAQPGPRLPLTAERDLFAKGVELGQKVLWLQTYGSRYWTEDDSRPRHGIPQGAARVTKAIPTAAAEMPEGASYDADSQSLHVGTGEIGPVAPEVWAYSVSGMAVVSKWLSYRRKRPAGRKTSALNDIVTTEWPAAWTSELLELLWVLEQLVALECDQEALLDAVMEAPLVTVDDLVAAGVFPIPEAARTIPRLSRSNQQSLLDAT